MAFLSNQTPTTARRVAVTGVGIVTAMGIGRESNAEGFRTGRVALRDVSLFDVSDQRAKIAGEVDLPASLPANHLSAATRRRCDRASAMLIHAASEAWIEADGDSLPGIRERPLPIVLGTSAGAMQIGQDYFEHAVEQPDRERNQRSRVLAAMPQTQPQILAEALGVSGSSTLIANACASGANAIGHAFELIRDGAADFAICGGYDALCKLVYAGFDSLQALSPDLPRPFDADRNGLAIGEGAAVLFLESYESAMRRGAPVQAEILGYGAATDRHHLTQPHPEGDAALRSMREATAAAHIAPDEVDYINSHGTGTPLNDVAEAHAIRRWAGDDAANIAVSSTKSSIGHLLGGAGAVETAICLLAMNGGWLPPTSNVDIADPACTFDLVTQPREAALRCALTNSFGFGGANATLILRKPGEPAD